MATQVYVPRRFGAHELPIVGRRIRFAPEGAAALLPLFSETTSRVFNVPAGTLCDVIATYAGSNTVDVDVHVKDANGEPVTHRVADIAADNFVSVKGRPFVVGVDDRRNDLAPTKGGSDRDGDSEDEATEAAPAIVPKVSTKVTAVPKVPAAAALEGLAEALGITLGGGVDEATVRTIVDEAIEPLADAVSVVQGESVALGKRVTEAERKLNDALDALATASPAVRSKVRIAVSGAKVTGNPIADALAEYYAIGEDRGANLLLASPPSLGKSFAVREFGRAYDLYLEHGCSDEMDEIGTLLGSPVPDGEGGFIVVDGVLSQAVRAASEGKSVLLLLDEILRLAPRAQEWLLSFLTGRKRTDGTRYYELRTRRVTADGSLETVTCDAANLHIVSATNLGMIAPVEAFWSRWETKRFQFDPATIRAVSLAVLGANGVTGPNADKLAAVWTTVVTESRKEVAKGTIRFPADIRLLERAATLDTTGDAKVVARKLSARLVDNLAHWTADLGDTDAESVKACEKWVAALVAL